MDRIATDLDEIKTLLAVGYCNPLWRTHVEKLIAEVEHLRSILDIIGDFPRDDVARHNESAGGAAPYTSRNAPPAEPGC